VETINIEKLEVDQEGNIVKKKNTIKHSKDNALEKHEQEQLIKCINELDIKPESKLKYRILVALTMEAGLRVTEAIQTRLDWINETEDGITINIPKKDRDLRNMKRDWKPKTSAGAREVIFLSANTGSMVQTYLIGNNRGLGFSRQRAGQIIKELGSKINKPLLHPHALRSTYANGLVYMGCNASTLMYYMGWANLNTALNYVRTSKIAARTDLLKKAGLFKEV
jgi:integrase